MNAILLHNRNLFILFVGKLFLLTGNRFSALVIPWIVLQQTNSPLKTSLVTFCSLISPLLFSIPAGVYIERSNKRLIGILSELVRGIAMLFLVILALSDLLTLMPLIIILIITGFAGLTYRISFNAMLPSIAGRKNIMSTHNYIEGADAIGTMIGPVLAGIVFTKYGAGVALSIDVIVIFISMLSLILIQEKRLDILKPEPVKKTKKRTFIRDTFHGFSYIFSDIGQKILTITHFTLNFTTVFIMLLVIIHAEGKLGLSVTETGLLITAAGIGNIIGVWFLPRFKDMPWVTLLLISLSLSALGVFIFTIATTFWLAFLGMIFFDGALSMAFVVHSSATQALTADHYLARVSSSRYFISGAAALLGNFIAGAISEFWSSNAALLLGFSIMLITIILIAVCRPINKSIQELNPS